MSFKTVKLGEITELINGDRSSKYPSGTDIVNSATTSYTHLTMPPNYCVEHSEYS